MAHVIASLAENLETMVMDEGAAVPKEEVAVPKEEVAVPKEVVAVPKEVVAVPKEEVAVPKEKLGTIVMLSGRRQKKCPAELNCVGGCDLSRPCGCFFCRKCKLMSPKCTCIYSRTMKVSGATIEELRATGRHGDLGVKHQKIFKEHGAPMGSHGLPWAPMKNKVWSRWPQYDRKLKPTKLFHDKGEEVETEVD